MATNLIEERRSSAPYAVAVSWGRMGRMYECRGLICPEEEGGYSAIALALPGVASQGETLEEAIANLADAFQAAIQTYLEDGSSIPWGDVDADRTPGCVERWIVVNV